VNVLYLRPLVAHLLIPLSCIKLLIFISVSFQFIVDTFVMYSWQVFNDDEDHNQHEWWWMCWQNCVIGELETGRKEPGKWSHSCQDCDSYAYL